MIICEIFASKLILDRMDSTGSAPLAGGASVAGAAPEETGESSKRASSHRAERIVLKRLHREVTGPSR